MEIQVIKIGNTEFQAVPVYEYKSTDYGDDLVYLSLDKPADKDKKIEGYILKLMPTKTILNKETK